MRRVMVKRNEIEALIRRRAEEMKKLVAQSHELAHDIKALVKGEVDGKMEESMEVAGDRRGSSHQGGDLFGWNGKAHTLSIRDS